MQRKSNSVKNDISIVPYRVEQNEEALFLEALCPQGEEIMVRFIRPTFHKRSEVYERAIIFSAVCEGKLIGIATGAEKELSLHGETIHAAYGFDLRVHPAFRKFGTAKRLTDAFKEYFGNKINCNYTYIAGQNKRALAHVRMGVGSRVAIPMTYFIFPVYKPMIQTMEFTDVSMDELHSLFLKNTPGIDFVPTMKREKMHGYISSITDGNQTGTSIWTNEEILAEQVLRLPTRLSMLRFAQQLFSPILRLPNIPKIGETIKSWFLFDLFAKDEHSLRQILAAVNEQALDKGKDFLYVLLYNNDPLTAMIKQTGIKYFTIPYIFMANGDHIPGIQDRLYVDIRDL